jgi:hypothetical protein
MTLASERQPQNAWRMSLVRKKTRASLVCVSLPVSTQARYRTRGVIVPSDAVRGDGHGLAFRQLEMFEDGIDVLSVGCCRC